LAAARVWVDRRDGKGWVVEKRHEVVEWGEPTGELPVAVERPFLRFCRPQEDYLVELTPDTPLDAFSPDQLLGLFERAKAEGRIRARRAPIHQS
jgi:hypothetical protein